MLPPEVQTTGENIMVVHDYIPFRANTRIENNETGARFAALCRSIQRPPVAKHNMEVWNP